MPNTLITIISFIHFSYTNSFLITKQSIYSSLKSTPSLTQLSVTPKIPTTNNDRDNQAIQSIQAAIKSPRNQNIPYIECEFPPLSSLNKLGDGSLRSSKQAEQANLAFAIKLLKSRSFFSFFSKNKYFLILPSSSSSKFIQTAKTQSSSMNNVQVSTLSSLELSTISKDDTCVFLTPSSSSEYNAAKAFAIDQQITTIVINGFAKDTKSIPNGATMAYYLKPLTYNSQIAGFLLRCYPSQWITCTTQNKVLNSQNDDRILVKNTNTPDLRQSVALVSKFVSDSAIQQRNQ